MKTAVLLLAHGAPERVEDVPEYLRNVLGGGPVPPPLAAEIEGRYRAIGGASPLAQRTREQAAALAGLLGMPVSFAMRHWTPFIHDVMAGLQADGIERIVALCLAPQYSRLSVGQYFRRVEEARQSLGMSAELVWTKSFHDHPLLVQAFAEKLPQGRKVLFTAHSLPQPTVEDNDPYDGECRRTAALVAARAGLADWDFAYQSQGTRGGAWLGPTVESRIDEYAARGLRELVIHPIGFVSDHVEILYDVDIGFRRYARSRGVEIHRPESLNSSPKFIEALADVVRGKLK